jgi:DNA-binding transcriptional MerR regulator
MTVGQLSRCTGLSVRLVREYERLGLIYSAGRSEGNYRMFDEIALWCVDAVERLRSTGLTLAAICELAALFGAGEGELPDRRFEAPLERSGERIETRIAELTAIRERIRAHHAERVPPLALGEIAARRLDSPPGARA